MNIGDKIMDTASDRQRLSRPDGLDAKGRTMQVQGQTRTEEAILVETTAAPAHEEVSKVLVHHTYRADIDGLRALAVLPVVFFHAGIRGFSGGFVGVDIFFVISGYLITGILAREVLGGRLLIREFYRRRILRIFPALFVMFAVVTIAACATMLPSEINKYARSLAAAALFSSNIQFFFEVNYFALSSAVRPLLHTWSLAVEEQWYIVWPLAIAAVGAKRSHKLLPLALAITGGSLAIGIWQTSVNPAAAFYLLPSRAWELGLGAIVVLLGRRALPRWQLEMAGLLGLTLILGSIKLYSHETPFPGIAALAPCIGAALLLYTGAYTTWVAKLLSIAPARFFGEISYSLYLWHWPVIVFAQIGLFLPKTNFVIAGEIALSVLLAIISWRFIEQPFRATATISATRTLISGAASIGVVIAAAWLTPTIGGLFMKLTPSQSEVAKYIDLDGDALYRRGVCFAVGAASSYDKAHCLDNNTGKQAILFVGDSHAAALWPGLSRYTKEYDIHQATATSCVAKLYERPETTYCGSIINLALRDWVPAHHPAFTLFASRWKNDNLLGLETTLNNSNIKAGNPVLIGPIPEYSAALPRLLVFAERKSDPALMVRSLDPEVKAIDSKLREMALRTATPFISLIDLLCTDQGCITTTPSGAPLQFDQGHLSAEGSEFLVDALILRLATLKPR